LESIRKANPSNLCFKSNGEGKNYRKKEREFYSNGEKHTFIAPLIGMWANSQN
jgi:hypothetical protein